MNTKLTPELCQSLQPVPAGISMETLTAALHDGRLYILPGLDSPDAVYAELDKYLSRIRQWQGNQKIVNKFWHALLADEQMRMSFVSKAPGTIDRINGYRLAAVVRRARGLFLYDYGIPFQQYCEALFPIKKAEVYRKNASKYVLPTDEEIIQKALSKAVE